MKSLLIALEKAAILARFPLPQGPLLPWPRFSLASYAITARLQQEGIVPRTVIDVGANIGQFSVSCVKRFGRPRIYAFEPVPEAFQKLVSATKRYKSVTAYNMAVGERDGTVSFNVASDLQSSSILKQTAELSSSFVTRTVEVQMKTLEMALRGIALEPPVLLKLDVQGYEAKVIEGGRSLLDSVDFVVAETSFTPLYEGEITFGRLGELLRQKGFTFLRPVGVLVSPETGAFLQIDALFCRSGDDRAKRRRWDESDRQYTGGPSRSGEGSRPL